MIAYIEGKITQKQPTQIIIESGGIGYAINISLNTYTQIQHLDKTKLHIYLHISGGAQTPIMPSLYGFAEEKEKQMFIDLLSISGVGASTVRMVLSALSPEDIQHAIVTENIRQFESIKGIGPKTAKRIILELKDKMMKLPVKSEKSSGGNNNMREEALSALVMLGFNRQAAEVAVQKVMASHSSKHIEDSGQASMTLEDIIKLVLKTI